MARLDIKPNISDHEEVEILTSDLSLVALADSRSSAATISSYSSPFPSSKTFDLPPEAKLKTVRDYDCPFLDALPLEIRQAIYAKLLPEVNQHIELTRPIERREPLVRAYKGLMFTCHKTNSEVKAWYRGIKNQFGFMETMQFGPINPDHTLFVITVEPDVTIGGSSTN